MPCRTCNGTDSTRLAPLLAQGSHLIDRRYMILKIAGVAPIGGQLRSSSNGRRQADCAVPTASTGCSVAVSVAGRGVRCRGHESDLRVSRLMTLSVREVERLVTAAASRSILSARDSVSPNSGSVMTTCLRTALRPRRRPVAYHSRLGCRRTAVESRRPCDWSPPASHMETFQAPGGPDTKGWRIVRDFPLRRNRTGRRAR